MVPSAQEKEQLQFGSITNVLLVQNGRLQKLYDEKFKWQLALLSLGVTQDKQRNRMLIPEGKAIECRQIFQEILRIQEQINHMHSVIRVTREEVAFVQTTD